MEPKPSHLLEAVARQYEEFPYPPLEVLEQEDPQRDLRESFNTDLGLGGSRSLKPGARVWVPGCGTRWAVMVALQFRDVSIVAGDVSVKSLALQQRLAASLGLENIEFRQENLLEVPYEGEFDFISCVGVLHHLPVPAEGFQKISRALKPSGLAEIMVYDVWNRHYSHRMGEILRAFDPAQRLEARERFELAAAILRSANSHVTAPPELARIVEYLDSWPGFVEELADFVSHPLEHYFDVPKLVESCRNAGLSPRAWKMPSRFDPSRMLNDSHLQARIGGMEEHQRAHLGHLLSTGLLEVFVERSGAEKGEVSDLRSRTVRAIPHTLVHHVVKGKVERTERLSKMKLTEGGRRFDGGERRPAVASYGIDLDCIRPKGRRLLSLDAEDEDIQAVLETARTPVNIGELVDSLSSQSGRQAEQWLRLCSQLCRTPYRVLAIA